MSTSSTPSPALDTLARRLDETASFEEAVELTATWMRDFTDCEAVTVRIGQEAGPSAGWLPVCLQDGLAAGHVKEEAAVRFGSCVCGRVAEGDTGSQPFFSQAGSFAWGRVQSLTTDFSSDELGPLRGRCVAEGFESMVVIPLVDGEERLGVIHIADHEPDRFLDLLPELEESGRVAGAALARHDRQRSELLARRFLEAALLPAEPPAAPGLEIGVSFVTASTFAQMGGDFYEVVPLEDGRTFFFVGDYAGRGMEAAGMASEARRILAGLATAEAGPAEILEQANTMLSAEGHERSYLTAAAVLVDPETGILRTALAGHPPPLVIPARRDEGAYELTAPFRRPLGIEPDSGYEEARHRLDRGEILLLFTDGVTEARRAGVLFGTEGVERVCRSADAGLSGITSLVCGTSSSYHDPALPPDDRLVLAVMLTG